MDTFTPIWSQIVTSSVWSEPYYVRVLWLTMLAVKDRDYVVRKTAFALSRLANMSEQEVLDGLKVLSGPDTKRIEPQPNEGRRIERVEDGWLILNGKVYQDEMTKLFRRARNAESMRERRARGKVVIKPLGGEGAHEKIVKERGEEEAQAHVERVNTEVMEIINPPEGI